MATLLYKERKKDEYLMRPRADGMVLKSSERPVVLAWATECLSAAAANSGQIPTPDDLVQDYKALFDHVEHFGIRYTTNAVVVLKSSFEDVQGTVIMLHEWSDLLERMYRLMLKKNRFGKDSVEDEDDE